MYVGSWRVSSAKWLIVAAYLVLLCIGAKNTPNKPFYESSRSTGNFNPNSKYLLTPSRQAELKFVADASSGVFQSASTREMRPELQKVVIVTAANSPYFDQVVNFACWLERLDMKAMVFSLDRSLHERIVGMYRDTDSTTQSVGPEIKNPTDLARDPDPVLLSALWDVGGLSSVGEYRTKQFHAVTTTKLSVTKVLLEMGYDVLFIDVDVALLRDPFPYLLWENVDYVHSVNKLCPDSDKWLIYAENEEGNTGFHFIRASNASIRLFDAVISDAPNWPNIDDQNIFWKLIRDEKRLQSKNGPSIVALPSCRHFNYSGLIRPRVPSKVTIERQYPSNKYARSTSAQMMGGGPVMEYPGYAGGDTASAHMEKASARSSQSAVTNPHELVMCPLDGCVFSSGALRGVAYTMLQKGLEARNETSVSIHANFIKGKSAKVSTMSKFGLWLAVGEGVHPQARPRPQPALEGYCRKKITQSLHIARSRSRGAQ